MKGYNCIIVDDDELDRITVTSFAKRCGSLQISGIFSSATDALPSIMANPPDILFLDIDMEGMNGLELRREAAKIPVCIFITAHAEHAVESFELDTLDFIVKPVKFDRFEATVARINDYMEIRHKAALFEDSVGGDAIYIKEGHQQVKIKLHDILYLEALKDYTKIVTAQKRHCVLSSLGTLLKEPHFASFLRVHRSYAVQKQFVEKILPNEIVLNGGVAIPVGRSYKENLNLIL